ncbi:MAG: hypothetical protein EBY16_06535 [Gammaproteobacteria bacterium]|nr:hypothetical protein [Gammaproteobacteria bacterium]
MPSNTVQSLFFDAPDTDNYFLAVEKIKRLLQEGVATKDMSRINLTLTGVHTNFHYVPMTVTSSPHGPVVRYETFATAEKTPHTTLPANIGKRVIGPYLKSAGNEHHGLEEHSREANTIVMANVLHQLLADPDIASLVAANPGILNRLRLIQGEPIHDCLGHTMRSRADYYPLFTEKDGKIEISTRTPEQYDAYVRAQHENSYEQRIEAGMLATALARTYLGQQTVNYGIEYVDASDVVAIAAMQAEYDEATAIQITLAGPLTALADEHKKAILTDAHLAKVRIIGMLFSEDNSLNIFGDNYNLAADPDAAQHVLCNIFPKLPLERVVCMPTDAFKGAGNTWAQMLKSNVDRAAAGDVSLGIGPEMAKLKLLYAKGRAWNWGLPANQIRAAVLDAEARPVMEPVLEPVLDAEARPVMEPILGPDGQPVMEYVRDEDARPKIDAQGEAVMQARMQAKMKPKLNAQGEVVMQARMTIVDHICPYDFDLALLLGETAPEAFIYRPYTYEIKVDDKTGAIRYMPTPVEEAEVAGLRAQGKMVVLFAQPIPDMLQQPNALVNALHASWIGQLTSSASVSEYPSAGLAASLGIFVPSGGAAATEPAPKRQQLEPDSVGNKP